MNNLKAVTKKVTSLESDYAYNRRRRTQERQKASRASRAVKRAVRASTFVQTLAQTIQQRAQTSIADLVTRCLEAVFDNPLKFEIRFEKKRNKTEAVMLFRDSKGNEVTDLRSATSGGACVDVAAFALRLAEVVLSRPAPRQLIVLDEPFRCVDQINQERLKGLIESLAKELGVQFVIVTHNTVLRAGKVVEVK